MPLPADLARHEIKFVTSPVQMFRIEEWLASHRFAFFEPYPPRQVNNIYFDTFDLDNYCDNLAGASSRYKLRLRWYGEEEDASPASLEVKHRQAGLGFKELFPTGCVPLAGLRWREIERRLRSHLTLEARVWLDANPSPILINRYRRRYFESADSGLRATLDWQQRVYDQRPYATPNFSRRANLLDTAVVEFKFDPSKRRLASELLQGFPLRVSRNSKYVISVQAILHG